MTFEAVHDDYDANRGQIGELDAELTLEKYTDEWERGEVNYVGRIRQIETLNKNTRFRGEFLGWFSEKPEVGQCFFMYGESLELKGGIRELRTSPVTEFLTDDDERIAFRTENSVYEITLY